MTLPPGHRQEIIQPEFLLRAYAAGYFPMADSREGSIGWYSPDPRGIIPLNGLRVTRSLRQAIQSGRFEERVDTSFEAVMRACAERDETWISEEIIGSYRKLFEMGCAHSVEAWSGGELAGGLYGVALGGAFFGESMFSARRDASKVALFWLVRRLRAAGFELLDTQYLTPHLATLGAVEVSREEYLGLLRGAVMKDVRF